MGTPKLLLPWGETTIMGRVLELLGEAEITGTVVVCRRDDLPLQKEVEKYGGRICLPDPDPDEMRQSVAAGLNYISEAFQPHPDEGWLLIPADHPLLSPEVLAGVVAAWGQSDADILVPTFRGKRGHPTLFRWRTAKLVEEIPADQGINALLRRQDVRLQEFPVEDERILLDLDTPEDYARRRDSVL